RARGVSCPAGTWCRGEARDEQRPCEERCDAALATGGGFFPLPSALTRRPPVCRAFGRALPAECGARGMPHSLGESFLSLGIALGLGLLVGLQRERARSALGGFRPFGL